MPVGSPDDVIAALATAPGTGALAVVRLTGARAVELADRLFAGKRRLADLGGFEGAHGWIRRDGDAVDEVVAWVYRAPATFTGEDLVEIVCHGGAVATRVLETALATGARPAEPGEFTRRAFLNGRIDLAQAEAVADLASARGALAQRQALFQLDGGLSRRVRELAGRAREVLARITVFLDFEEDEPAPPDVPTLLAELATTRAELERLAASHLPSRRLREGATIALVGRPNVGKSSLLNALVGADRAIVHEEPGTTRDVVDAVVEWGGIPVRLVDTAGIRGSDGAVERAGIERTRREAEGADLVLWVVDGSVAATAEDRAIGAELVAERTVMVLNKADLGTADGRWVNDYSQWPPAVLSAKTGDGVGALVEAIRARLLSEVAGAAEPESLWVTNARHARLLAAAVEALGRGESALRSGLPAELAAADLHAALGALAAITGDQAGSDLLETIFSRFCIGK